MSEATAIPTEPPPLPQFIVFLLIWMVEIKPPTVLIKKSFSRQFLAEQINLFRFVIFHFFVQNVFQTLASAAVVNRECCWEIIQEIEIDEIWSKYLSHTHSASLSLSASLYGTKYALASTQSPPVQVY